MKPAPFRYHRPASVDEAIALLAEHGYEAKLLAGGQSLIPAMNFRLAQPGVLIDLNGISDLMGIDTSGAAPNGIRIGAMTRQRQVERSEEVARVAPLVSETLPFVAHPQIRNRGTFGGSLAHADPAAELPAVLVALDGRMHLRGPSGSRELPAGEFFTGLFGTAMEPDEMLTAADLQPLPPGSGWAFDEVSRRHGDFALAGAATVLTMDDDGRCADARIVLFSVGDGPVRAENAAGCLIGHAPGDAEIEAAAEAAAEQDIDPPADIHASAAYRRQLVKVLVERTLTRALARARQ